jgi:hypothetical protein
MFWSHVSRSVRTQARAALCAAVATLAACGARYTQVPPRLDLAPYGRVALVTFATEESHADMGSLATRRFAEVLLANQFGVELLELGPADSSIRALAVSGDAAALAQVIGREKGVPAVFLGALKVSGVGPRGNVSPTGMHLRATVSAELAVQLVSTRSGGTLWRSSAAANGTVGRVAMANGVPAIAVRDQDEAYGEVVGNLVLGVTRDLRPTRVKQ